MKLTWNKCSCGSPTCVREYPQEIGVFYQGTGFDPTEKNLVNRAFEALGREQSSSWDSPEVARLKAAMVQSLDKLRQADYKNQFILKSLSMDQLAAVEQFINSFHLGAEVPPAESTEPVPAPETEPLPEVIRHSLFSVQVCVPVDWTDEQARAFAERECPAGTQNGWVLRTTEKGRPDYPVRIKCSARPDCVHMVFDA
jgi:hypothetical protein